MSKGLLLAGKIVISLALVVLVISLVSFQDEHRLSLKTGERIVSRSVVEEPTRYCVTLDDGGQRAIPRELVDSYEEIPGFWSILGNARMDLVILSVVLMVFPQIILAFRWWLILRTQGIAVGYRRTFLVTYAGFFFGNFLPGGAGGDLARAVLTVSQTDRKVAAVGTVVVDRLVGLVALLFVAAAVVSYQLIASSTVSPFRLGHPELHPAAAIIFVMLCSSVAGYWLYFSPLIRQSRAVRFVKGILPFFSVLRQADDVFTSVHRRKGLILQCLALSVVCQATSIIINFLLANALGMESVALHHMFIFLPIIFVVNALPISPGGFGVSEASYVYLFGAVGVSANQAFALAMLFRGCMIVTSLPGVAAAFMVRPARPPAEEPVHG